MEKVQLRITKRMILLKKKSNSICIVTGSRSDFGLLKNVINEIKIRDNWTFDLLKIRKNSTSLISKEVYLTLSEYEVKSSFEVENEISNSPEEVSKDLVNSIRISLSVFQSKSPDFILVLGDRHEILGSVISANLVGIPIAHISGGEVTHGSYDDSFRHAITKLSNIHFVKEEQHRLRLIRLGENPKFIYQVGNLAKDSISQLRVKSKSKLEEELNVVFGERNLLVVMHPETKGLRGPSLIQGLIRALNAYPDVTLFFTAPGNDVGAKEIDNEIRQFVDKRENAFYFASLGQVNYLSLMANCVGIVGNSSSALFEAPMLGLFTLNIGNRQGGRIAHDSIINCSGDFFEIAKGIEFLFQRVDSLPRNKRVELLMPGSEKISKKIVDSLENVNRKEILIKQFYDSGDD